MKKLISKAVIAFLAAVVLLTVVPTTAEAARPKQHNINLKSKKKTQNITISKGNNRVWLMVNNRFTGGNWKSSNKKVATVSKYGEVKARKVGKTTITFKTGKTTLKWNVKVTNPKTLTYRARRLGDGYIVIDAPERGNGYKVPADDYTKQVKMGNKTNFPYRAHDTDERQIVATGIDTYPLKTSSCTFTYHGLSGKSYVVKYVVLNDKDYQTYMCKKFHNKVKKGQAAYCPGCSKSCELNGKHKYNENQYCVGCDNYECEITGEHEYDEIDLCYICAQPKEIIEGYLYK